MSAGESGAPGLRVLLVTLVPPNARGAGAIPVLLHAALAGLRARGHAVTVLTLLGDDPGDAAAAAALRADGVEVHPVRHRPPRGPGALPRRAALAAAWLRGTPKRTLWFREPGVQRAIDALLGARRFDVVQVEDNAMGAYRYGGRGTPTFLVEYEVRSPRRPDWARVRTAPGARARLRATADELDWQRWAAYQRAVWRRFDRVQVFTARDAAGVAALAPDCAARVRVNPFGVAVPGAADPAVEVPDTLLFVGNFLHPPNADAVRWLAADILPRVRAQRPAARLVVVGEDPRGLVRDLAGDGVELRGRVPSVEAELARAAVVIAPVRIGGGQRMKVLQAMAAGRAVVTTARGAEGLGVVGEAPPLALADDADGIAAAAVRLLERADDRRALGDRARAFVIAHFSPDAYARRLEAIYDELCAHTAGSATGDRRRPVVATVATPP